MTASLRKITSFLAIFLLGFPLYANCQEIKPVLDPTSFSFVGSNDAIKLLKLFNNEDFGVEWNASVFSWEQEDGKDELVTSSEVVVEPSSIRLSPHSGAEIRIQYLSFSSEREKAFRVVLTANVLNESSMTVKYTHSLPVFVEATNRQLQLHLSFTKSSDSMLAVHVYNDGYQHRFIKTVRITGLDARGEQVFVTARPGWYLLAGKDVAYSMNVSAADCKNSVQFNANIDLMDGNSVKANVGSLTCTEDMATLTGFEQTGNSTIVPIDVSKSDSKRTQ